MSPPSRMPCGMQPRCVQTPSGAVLADCPNLILTPHIAGVTVESNVRVSHLIAVLVAGHLSKAIAQ